MYYESCLDVNDTVETLGAKPMLDLIQKLGGWNITKPKEFNPTSKNFFTSISLSCKKRTIL